MKQIYIYVLCLLSMSNVYAQKRTFLFFLEQDGHSLDIECFSICTDSLAKLSMKYYKKDNKKLYNTKIETLKDSIFLSGDYLFINLIENGFNYSKSSYFYSAEFYIKILSTECFSKARKLGKYKFMGFIGNIFVVDFVVSDELTLKPRGKNNQKYLTYRNYGNILSIHKTDTLLVNKLKKVYKKSLFFSAFK